MTVDSGSVDIIGLPTVGKGIPIKVTAAPNEKKNNRAANGGVIQNLGEKLIGQSAEGDNICCTVQIGKEVANLLGSVDKNT